MKSDTISKPERVAAGRTDVNGKRVKIVFRRDKTPMQVKFSPGTVVEVRSDEDGYEGAWYGAIVVGSARVDKFVVEYQTLKTEDEKEFLKEVANEQDIRPCPPEIPQSNRYKAFEEVDAWYNDGWWECVIYEVLDDWKYIVYFASTTEKLIYHHPNLRPRQNWVDGKWVPAFLKSRKEKKIDAENPLQETFREGMLVEVKSDEDGYHRSWYGATIIRLLGMDKFLVEYDSLKTNDENQPLREEVSATDVRPLPPCNLHHGHYKRLEEVDVWCAGGWWIGEIYKVLNRKKYIVQFAFTGNKREVDHSSLRSHQDWIHGKWITSKHRSSDSNLRNSSSERKYNSSEGGRSFGKGEVVEVRSDEPGYEGSWYSAVVVSSTRKGRFLVKYLTLKSEDGRNSLREEVDAQNIRPCPPKIEADGCYFLLEKVDAWHNDGWWTGVISKLLVDSKYMVYFETTKEDLEFDRINLRTHQEWINGKWITANKVMYSKLEQLNQIIGFPTPTSMLTICSSTLTWQDTGF
ncbi:hypothetical protein SOVF_068990 [Spinacia oleracea]|nr:hypothetical protein SOVF_068990 [Spinacia oleracea]